jgi:hypothetical protein
MVDRCRKVSTVSSWILNGLTYYCSSRFADNPRRASEASEGTAQRRWVYRLVIRPFGIGPSIPLP